MAEVLLADTAFFKAFEAFEPEAVMRVPAWLREMRAADMAALAAMPVLTTRDEEWKYTPLAGLWRQGYAPSMRSDGVIPEAFRSAMVPGALNLLFCNGQYLGTPVGDEPEPSLIAFFSGDAAFTALDLDRRYFAAITSNDAPIFAKLNRAFFVDPLVLRVPRGVKIDRLVHIIHLITVPESCSFPRILVRVDANASVNILETFLPVPGSDYLSVPVTDIVLEEGACVEHVQVHRHNPEASHVGATRVWAGRDAEYRSVVSTTGAGIFRNNLSVMIEGEGASVFLNGLHALKGEAHADSHTLMEHIAPNAKSDQLYKCVLDNESRSVFNGKVKVHREAQQTSSYQLNKNLLLSRGCRADTKPQLEIMADDVKCTHGATIGQLNEDQLFYLRTRCLSRDDAARMLVRGFMDDVLNTIKDPVIRKYAV